MGTTDVSLVRIFNLLADGNLGLAIGEVQTYLSAWPNPQTLERLNTLKEDYTLMEDYWRRGVKDPQRQEQYQRLLQRLYVLCANMAIHRHIAASSYLQGLSNAVRQSGFRWSLDSIRKEMVDFVTEVAMLELEPEGQRDEKRQALYKQHQQQMNALFNYVVTSRIWTDNVGGMMHDLLLSPMVDSNDQQLLVSAVTLSLMNHFDMVKFRLLTDVYQQSQDEAVRQRALVGWVLSLDDDWVGVYPEIRLIIDTLMLSKRVLRELTELQIQLVYTLNAEKDSTTIRQEIMPDLLKNNKFQLTPNGLEEKEEDALEDILNPDAAEQRMEKLEASFQRVQDMRMQGMDIFFTGFSQMKRFPFFYDMSNWMVPFYMQHPDIAPFLKGMEDNRFVDWIAMRGPFCNSDKYSFIMAVKDVIGRLPENIRNMMTQGDIPLEEVEDTKQNTPAYLRRLYLMDLYRFFRLFPNRSALYNPFDSRGGTLGGCLFFAAKVFCGTLLDEHKREIVSMLLKHQYSKAAKDLMMTFPEQMRDVQYFVWLGDYEEALRHAPDNERALVGYARHLFGMGAFAEAEEVYDRLLFLHPGKASYMLNKAICLLKMSETDEAVQLLYQLNYEHPDDVTVSRALTWALVCSGKQDQAEKNYQQLTALDDATSEDFLNQGYCLWLVGKIDEAVASFQKYRNLSGTASEEAPFIKEHDLLTRHGISREEVFMMEAMVRS